MCPIRASVQTSADLGPRLPVLALDPKPGDYVLDLCASPGSGRSPTRWACFVSSILFFFPSLAERNSPKGNHPFQRSLESDSTPISETRPVLLPNQVHPDKEAPETLQRIVAPSRRGVLIVANGPCPLPRFIVDMWK